MKEIKIHKHWIKFYDRAGEQVDDLEVLYEFYKEGETSESEVDENCLLYTSPSPRD